jgi:cobalt-zinc-cadmium efflux system protein
LDSIGITQDRQKVKLLWWVLGLRSGLFLVELGTGLWSHSLSLLAGSGHLFSDLVVLSLTLLVTWLSQRESTAQRPFKYRRLEAWVALLNGVSLSAIAVLIAWKAIQHLQAPEPVLGFSMLIAAGLSLVINGMSIALLHEDSHHDLNVRGVLLHGVADAASAISLVLAALAVYYFNWLWADAVGSLLVAFTIGFSAIFLITASLRVFNHQSI